MIEILADYGYVRMYVSMFGYVRMYACMYVCMYVWVCIHAYLHATDAKGWKLGRGTQPLIHSPSNKLIYAWNKDEIQHRFTFKCNHTWTMR
jgi:hypothetical protein